MSFKIIASFTQTQILPKTVSQKKSKKTHWNPLSIDEIGVSTGRVRSNSFGSKELSGALQQTKKYGSAPNLSQDTRFESVATSLREMQRTDFPSNLYVKSLSRDDIVKHFSGENLKQRSLKEMVHLSSRLAGCRASAPLSTDDLKNACLIHLCHLLDESKNNLIETESFVILISTVEILRPEGNTVHFESMCLSLLGLIPHYELTSLSSERLSRIFKGLNDLLSKTLLEGYEDPEYIPIMRQTIRENIKPLLGIIQGVYAQDTPEPMSIASTFLGLRRILLNGFIENPEELKPILLYLGECLLSSSITKTFYMANVCLSLSAFFEYDEHTFSSKEVKDLITRVLRFFLSHLRDLEDWDSFRLTQVLFFSGLALKLNGLDTIGSNHKDFKVLFDKLTQVKIQDDHLLPIFRAIQEIRKHPEFADIVASSLYDLNRQVHICLDGLNAQPKTQATEKIIEFSRVLFYGQQNGMITCISTTEALGFYDARLLPVLVLSEESSNGKKVFDLHKRMTVHADILFEMMTQRPQDFESTTIIYGKGHHSTNGVPVLKRYILEWLESNRQFPFERQDDNQEGRISLKKRDSG